MDLGQMFIELSAEYPAIISAVTIIFAGIGIVIASSAVFDIIRAGRRDSANPVTSAVFWKMLGGASLVDLMFWARTWSETLWLNTDDLGVGSFADSGDGYWSQAATAAVGIFVITGYVTLGRAYLAATRLGYATPDNRADLVSQIFARIVAGSLLISSMHVASFFENSIQGFGLK